MSKESCRGSGGEDRRWRRAAFVDGVVRRSSGRPGYMGGLAKTLRRCHTVREVQERRC